MWEDFILMNDTTTKTSMKRVGDILKYAREKKGLTLTDVHKFIKIHPKYLQAMEDNDYSLFSGPVHVKGFLKIYARLLDLNVDEVLAFFRREYDEKKMGVGRIFRPIETPKVIVTPGSVIALSTIVLVLGFFSYLFYQYKSYTDAPTLVIENPKEDTTLSGDSIEVSGKTDRDSQVLLNSQKLVVDASGNFSTKIGLSEGINVLNFLAVNKLGKQSKLSKNVVVKKDDTAVMENLDKKVVLEVLASKGSSQIHVETDGRKAFDGTMILNTSSLFEATQSIKLKAANSGAIVIKQNGKELGVFGKANEAKEQEFVVVP